MTGRLRQWRTPLAFAVTVWLFYVASKGAYRGYFASDDLDNLAWTRLVPLSSFVTGLLSPFFYEANFRPTGHLFFWLMGRAAGLDFRPYIAAVHLLHAVNLGLIWLLLRRLGVSWPAQWTGALFFGFHMAVFDAYWKPMYVFDVLCALFSLLSILAWLGDRRWLSLLCFWFAYKSKELAVAVPLILALYEYLLGTRRMRLLVWHFAASLWFAAQALIAQAGKTGDYALRLTPSSVWRTMDFYASRILLLPHAGFALLALPVWIRDRRLWWGLAAAALWLAPMLLLPGRTAGAYLYLPLAGVSVAVAVLADRWHWKWSAPLLGLWLCFQYIEMRGLRRTELAEAAERRAYVLSLADAAGSGADIDVFLIDGAPATLAPWGIEGAVRYLFKREDPQWIYLSDPAHPAPNLNASLAMLSWDHALQRLLIRRRSAAVGDASYFEMTPLAPIWQLLDGWYQMEGGFRWTQPVAKARLRRPTGAREFSVTVNVGPDDIRRRKAFNLRVLLNGVSIGSRTFTQSGWTTETFPLPEGPEANVIVTLLVDPPSEPGPADPRQLGIAIGAFGFR